MKRPNTDIWVEVADYYSAKLAEYGETPQGVDWNSEESQVLRFEQLNKIIDASVGFSLNDLGCGYGALFDYLDSRYPKFTYNGCDVSDNMIRAAQNRHAASSQCPVCCRCRAARDRGLRYRKRHLQRQTWAQRCRVARLS